MSFFKQASQLEKLLPAVLPQFHQGLFSKDKKGSEEAKQRWLDAVKQATTVSRLHLLLEILDSTVIWDLSAENAVCMLQQLDIESFHRQNYPSLSQCNRFGIVLLLISFCLCYVTALQDMSPKGNWHHTDIVR